MTNAQDFTKNLFLLMEETNEMGEGVPRPNFYMASIIVRSSRLPV
jgi:hypothetical protein